MARRESVNGQSWTNPSAERRSRANDQVDGLSWGKIGTLAGIVAAAIAGTATVYVWVDSQLDDVEARLGASVDKLRTTWTNAWTFSNNP